jgi:hypothetical protein
MKHKNTSTQSNELLSYLHNKNKTCFAYKEALKIFPTAKENTVSKLLRNFYSRLALNCKIFSERCKTLYWLLFRITNSQPHHTAIAKRTNCGEQTNETF